MAVFGPLLEITRIQSEINKLFDHLVDLKRSEDGSVGKWTPNVDVCETNTEWVAKFELPGVEPEGIRLSVNGSLLVLAGEKVKPVIGNTAQFHCVERGFGKFHRAIQIGAAVNPRQARAEFRNGLLIVVFPKVENRRGEAVEIPVREGGGGS